MTNIEVFKNIRNMTGENTALDLFAQSVQNTYSRSNFRDLLDWSYNKSIIVASDYAGEDGHSNYQVYTYTFQTYIAHNEWENAIRLLKQDKNYSGAPQFKGRKPRMGKKIDWMQVTADKFKGFIISFAVPSNIESLFAPGLAQLDFFVQQTGLPPSPMKPKEIEKALRVTFFGSMVLSLILSDGDIFFWQTDHDPIVAGVDRIRFCHSLIDVWMSNLTSVVSNRWTFQPPMSSKSFQELALEQSPSRKIPFDESSADYKRFNDFSEDLLSVSDLIAGSLTAFYNRKDKHTSEQDLKTLVPQKVYELLRYSSEFKMFSYCLHHNPDKGYYCGNTVFTLGHKKNVSKTIGV